MLASPKLLVHFDSKLEVACDVSEHEIGAALSHHMPDESKKSIGFVLRTLMKPETSDGGFSLYLWCKTFPFLLV